MSYYVQQKESGVTITKKNWDKLHEDHPELFTERPEHNGLFTELFDVDTRYDNGDVISLFYMPEKWYGDDVEECLSDIAPYVEDDSMLSFVGEDNAMWGYSFRNGTWNEMYGSLVCSDVRLNLPHLKEYVMRYLPDSSERRQLLDILDQLR